MSLLSAEYLNSQVARGVTLPDLKSMLRAFLNISRFASGKTPTTTIEAVEMLVEAKAVVDWVYTLDTRLNDNSKRLENVIRNVIKAGTLLAPETAGVAVEDNIKSDDRVVPPKKGKKTSIANKDFFQLDAKDWQSDALWKFIGFDPIVDQQFVGVAKVIVVDWTDSENSGVLVTRFNNLAFYTYTSEPPEDAEIEERYRPTTYCAKTLGMLQTLFKVWAPIAADAPFTISYGLPGYPTDVIPICQFRNGYDGNLKTIMRQATWEGVSPYQTHLTPILGPPHALRVLLQVMDLDVEDLPQDEKEKPQRETPPGDTPSAMEMEDVQPSGTGGGDPPAPVATTSKTNRRPATDKKTQKATEYLVARFGTQPEIKAMRAESTGDSSGEKASHKKTGQPMPTLVAWVLQVDSVMKKHQGQPVPAGADCPPKAKFVNKNFEDLFNRKISWLQECRTAADVIRRQRKVLKGASLKEFEDYLADADQWSGVSSFVKTGGAFVNKGDDIETYEEEHKHGLASDASSVESGDDDED
ncbi:hypothetical protein B0H11DRAFT_2216189 [Mycena galericulata]|nr:hypothetical protein B0H11DRAFT_2216189 [Mycena galericulata]